MRDINQANDRIVTAGVMIRALGFLSSKNHLIWNTFLQEPTCWLLQDLVCRAKALRLDDGELP